MLNTPERWRIVLHGRVQGVGMRPYIAKAAADCRITGAVQNDESGVVIEAQGSPTDLAAFLRLVSTGPPAARIDTVGKEVVPLDEAHGFCIAESSRHPMGHTDPPADRTPCDACLRELFDESNRRFRYPFITCSDCGPRFTFIERMPFDRDCTTMRRFPLCAACEAEYRNPSDRRFHAQVIACPECGPCLEWNGSFGPVVRGEPALATAIQNLRQGSVIAIKGIGGYHLACDATNSIAVNRLRQQKARGDKPFALMAASVEVIRKSAQCDSAEAELLLGPERPIILLRRHVAGALPVAEGVAPGTSTLGFMLPYTPLHHLLLDDRPLVMTSANRSGEPLVIDDHDATIQLRELCDGILSHNRRIAVRCDDSVVQCVEGRPYFVRRSRGFVPDPIHLPTSGETVLAIGGELKAAPALALGDRVYLGPHVGDLRSWESVQALEEAVTHHCQLLNGVPDVVACDAHPGYASARWATDFAAKHLLPLVRIFHHEAHAASWQVDSGCFDRPALVVCFDGTGYGPDGTIWGGEFFLTNLDGVTRVAHLKPVPLPGGDRAIEHPTRMALAHLWAAGLDWSDNLPAVASLSPPQRHLLQQQLERNVNCPRTSSMGRLFDAVAAIVGLRNTITYEAQAAIELEAQADPWADGVYEFGILESEPMQLDPAPLLSGVLADLRRGVPNPTLAGKFHRSVSAVLVELAIRMRQQFGVSLVGLTGGVFQNRVLLDLSLSALRAAGFEVHLHHQLPCNDGGLAVGQAVLARRSRK